MSIQILPNEYGGSIFGRLGKGVGKGISEALPREIERGRLGAGLKKLERASTEENLTPMQFFTRAAALPGATPQIVETLGKLAKQQMQGQALKGFAGKEGAAAFPGAGKAGVLAEEGGAPSITTRTPIEATLNPYIPKTTQELTARAGQLFEENPAFFQNDPQAALQYAQQEDQQEQARNQALQGQRINEQNVQGTVTSALRQQQQNLGAQVPSNVYSDIENEAIQAVKSVKDGGRGLTEQQAMKEYGDKLDLISRDYSAIDALGNWSLTGKKPSETGNAIKSLQHKFAQRKDLENFANSLQSKNALSAPLAYNLAFPMRDNKALQNEFSKIPNIERQAIPYRAPPSREKVVKGTQDLIPSLAAKMGKEGSPLSIAHELKIRGYDPSLWMNYLRENREKLDLSERQGRELDKATNLATPLNDVWLESFADLHR